MSTEREQIDQVARELRRELADASRRIWERVEDPEGFRDLIRRHPFVSTGVGVGGGFLSGRLLAALIAQPRRVARRLKSVATGLARTAGASLFLVARELARPNPLKNGVSEAPTPSAKR